MKGYLFALAGAILLSAVAAAILPEGKMGKFVRGMLRLFTLTVLVAPFVGLTSGKLSFDKEASGGETAVQSDYLERCAEMASAMDEAAIAFWLRSEYGFEGEVSVSRVCDSGFSVQKIEVKITDFGITSSEEHIDRMAQIARELKEQYGCEAEVK